MAALAILGVVGGFLGPAIEIAKLIAAPIGRQFNYLCCFRSNIKTLEDEAIKLNDEISGVLTKTSNNPDIVRQFGTWLKNSNDTKNDKDRISAGARAPNVASGCLKLRERYSLSKEAKKTTTTIKDLIAEKRKFVNMLSDPEPVPANAPIQSGTKVYDFKSRSEIEEDIMQTLKAKKVYKIGICGMGGLGKTTLAKKIMNRALDEGFFDEIVIAVVSQPVNKLNVQLQIAELLCLTLEEETLIPRAHKLRERLRDKHRTLLVLDDVWESLNLEELGIPCEDGCIVLLTSRDKHVFEEMDVKKVCELKVLQDDDAWILFRGNAGACVDDAELAKDELPKDVMKECKGLPLALEIVGVALKGEKKKAIWRDALDQLRRAYPAGISNVIEKVYNPLKLSYDRLDDENAKSLFLLCGFFPEDYNISTEHLPYFAMGLRLFKGIWELEKVRDRTTAVIETLKTRCLLLDGFNDDHVRMHDVVRDVSIYIASEEESILVPPQSSFPKSKLLFMIKMNSEMEEMSDNLIGGSTTGLNVLFIEDGLLKSLPLIISLTTLVLHDCALLESIAVVGQLESLEILICHDCNSIKEFPEQVRRLKCLKLLEISRCKELKRIAAGVISSLVALEELKIVDSFNDWKGGEIDEERNDVASLREIESLKKLRCLNIDVSDIALAAQPLRLSFDKLVQFTVRFGKSEYVYEGSYQQSYQRRMYLHSRDKSDIIDFGDLSANIFLTRAECLSLSAIAENNQDFNLDLAIVQNIRWLNLERFTNKKNITSAAASFPLLEYLSLEYLRNLEEIWDDAPIQSNSFNNLKELSLVGLRALKRMGKCVLSTSKDFFLQLECIYINGCKEMEHLLVLVPNVEGQDKEDHSTVLIFPKLNALLLNDLPKLTNLICSRGIESIQFPDLARMVIEGCENLKWLVSRDDDGDHYKDDEDDSLHLFCNPKVSFPNLKVLWLARNVESKKVWCDKVPIGFFTGLVELKIYDYNKIRRLFSSSSKIPQNLVNLQQLWIKYCDEMVKVIEDEEEVSSSSSCDHPTNPTTTPLFPSLQEIWLYMLPKLESFCEWRCALKLPSLKKVRIDKCCEMKSFNAAAGSLVITPALSTVEIDFQALECVDGLNAALHQLFPKAKEQREAREAAYRNRMAEEEEEEEEGSREGHERNGEIDDSSTISTEAG